MIARAAMPRSASAPTSSLAITHHDSAASSAAGCSGADCGGVETRATTFGDAVCTGSLAAGWSDQRSASDAPGAVPGDTARAAILPSGLALATAVEVPPVLPGGARFAGIISARALATELCSVSLAG